MNALLLENKGIFLRGNVYVCVCTLVLSDLFAWVGDDLKVVLLVLSDVFCIF